jgi:tetratricopeptide (TPR) repeat protein
VDERRRGMTRSDIASLEDIARLRARAASLHDAGDRVEAAQIDAHAIELEAGRPPLSDAIRLLAAGRLANAEAAVRTVLDAEPGNVAALCLLGDIANRLGIYTEAEARFRTAVNLAPAFVEAKVNLARVLFRTGAFHEGLALLDAALAIEPRHRSALSSKLATLGQIGAYQRSQSAHEAALADQPDQPWLWVSYGNVCKTLGLYNKSVAAFRQALALDPRRAEAWWGIANLKRAAFDDADRQAMHDLSATLAADDPAQVPLNFSLGKAYEDAHEFVRSFEHYDAGNRVRRAELRYDAAAMTAEVSDSIAFFDSAYFADRTGGDDEAQPIFIVGMPRAGSTLVEQILSSHSAIEGTSELPYIPLATQKAVADRWTEARGHYPQILAALDANEVRALAAYYMQAAGQHRQTDRPHFIDKQPNNWLNIGLIRTLFPRAKIIDARREPMACCFANFKQHFARGQGFAYSLTDMGRYYRDYIRFMDHVDGVLPGAVHRLVHERLIDDPEAETRALLAYLDLPFEEQCLRFYENARPVRTPSAEQVRRPINRDAVDLWRHYEPWLQPLKEALGDLAA